MQHLGNELSVLKRLEINPPSANAGLILKQINTVPYTAIPVHKKHTLYFQKSPSI